ncbi:MAG: Rid family detoxifying hydrolase [Thermoleophilia bacterium]|nr:Rid family detoxifying hydrolase [Thermoleophilia bacterium]
MLGKSVVRTEDAPAPFAGAPYSQAVVTGGLVYTAGQVPIDPATGALVDGGIAEQTEQVFRNLAAILEAAGSGLEHLVKTTVFLLSLEDFTGMNEVYASHVGDRPPARSTVEVSRLPAGALVEIDAVAHL